MTDPSSTFTCEDLEALSASVVASWRSGADLDWRERTAGTLDWSCARAADHAVDTVYAPAFFLLSRRTHDYPEHSASTPGPDATPAEYVENLEMATRLMVAVVRQTPDDVRAIIWRRPAPEVRGPVDFPARAAVELALHAHDVCAGLGVPFVPPVDGCERLRRHVADWPYWTSPAATWPRLTLEGDPWDDLLASSGRGPALR